jgi:CHAT domain-containing protein
MIERHEVILVPSASAVAALRASPRAAQHAGMVAVLADPVFDRRDPRLEGKRAEALALPADLKRSIVAMGLQRLARLPGTRVEAERILSLVPAEQRLGALGFDARRTLALDPAVARYRVLHFATHGLLNSTHPELSGLVLSLLDPRGEAQNGFLRLQDVYQMRIDADLVVLSACQTALGKPVQGEGLVGLTRGFIHAGARQVLSSLWKVPDRATSELMKEVYQAMLVEGLRPGPALRQAQRKLLATRPFDGPESWAAFVLQGDWQGPPLRSGDARGGTSP